MSREDMEQYIEVLLALSGYGYNDKVKAEKETPTHEFTHDSKETAQPCML